MQTGALIILKFYQEKNRKRKRIRNKVETMLRLELWFRGEYGAHELVIQAESQTYMFAKIKRSTKNILEKLYQSINTEVLTESLLSRRLHFNRSGRCNMFIKK